MTVKLRFNLAQDLFEAFPIIREDISAEPSEKPSLEYLSELLVSATPENAITFCAYLLPRREAVWWGHQCLSRIPEILLPVDSEHLQIAENWVRQPEEQERVIALNSAMEADPKTPGVWVALAAGWSGGSMVEEGMSPVSPPPYLTAKAINAGILGALASLDTLSRAKSLKDFVEMGEQLIVGEQ
jgi:hypothetical protein